MQFPPFDCHLFLPFSSCASRNARDPLSHPHKTRGKIIISYDRNLCVVSRQEGELEGNGKLPPNPLRCSFLRSFYLFALVPQNFIFLFTYFHEIC
jgi:hypothetical protein